MSKQLLPVSYSRVSKWRSCPYSYYLKYMEAAPEPEVGGGVWNAAWLGTAVHWGIQQESEAEGVRKYREKYSDPKAEYQVKRAVLAALALPQMTIDAHRQYEYEINDGVFHGFVDCINGPHDIVDFKLSNNRAYYMDSPQLAIYKSELNRLGFDIQYCAYLFIPKIIPRKNETFKDYETRFSDYAAAYCPVTVNESAVTAFWRDAVLMLGADVFPVTPGAYCKWCGYKGGHCFSGE